MKKVILVGGDLAGGKSTYANIIGKKLNILVVNKDNLKEIIGDTILAKDRSENKTFSKISFDIMKYLLKKNPSILILESNFKPKEMEELKIIFHEEEYKVLSLVFKGKDEILHKRFLQRLKEGRHYVHKSQDFTNIEDFKKTLEELRMVKYPEEIIPIDCSDFSYQNNLDILEKIMKFVRM